MNAEKLTDRFGRAHDYLRIALTEKCNLRCFYCMPPDGIQLKPKSHLMTADEIESIVENFMEFGIKKVRFTGGEPLVRKDAGAIFQRIGDLGVELGLTTNGVMVDRYIDTFKEAGLKSVNISLDSLQRKNFKKITRRDNLEKVTDNVKLLLDEGFQVKLNTVVMKGVNDHEVQDLVRLTLGKPLEVKFIEFMPFSGNQWEWEKCVSNGELLQRIKTAFGGNVRKLKDGLHDTSKSYCIPDAKGKFGFISTVTEPFCEGCNRIRLTADGKMKNCLFSPGETDLLSPFREGKDIRPLMFENIRSKAERRGGMKSFSDFSNKERNGQNRSMIKIGG